MYGGEKMSTTITMDMEYEQFALLVPVDIFDVDSLSYGAIGLYAYLLSHPDDWDGVWEYGVDGTTTAGYNITSSEMGHLYYTELGNDGYFDTSGNTTGCSESSPYCLTNTGDFQNLQALQE